MCPPQGAPHPGRWALSHPGRWALSRRPCSRGLWADRCGQHPWRAALTSDVGKGGGPVPRPRASLQQPVFSHSGHPNNLWLASTCPSDPVSSRLRVLRPSLVWGVGAGPGGVGTWALGIGRNEAKSRARGVGAGCGGPAHSCLFSVASGPSKEPSPD